MHRDRCKRPRSDEEVLPSLVSTPKLGRAMNILTYGGCKPRGKTYKAKSLTRQLTGREATVAELKQHLPAIDDGLQGDITAPQLVDIGQGFFGVL